MPSDNQLGYLLQKWRKSQWGTTDNEVLIALEKRKIELLEDGNHSYIVLQAYLLQNTVTVSTCVCEFCELC